MSRSVVVLLASAVWGLAAPTFADLAEIKTRGVLRVLRMQVSQDNDEFFAIAPDSPPGFDREVLDGFANLHRLRLEPVTISSWDGLITALLQGKGEVVAGRFTITENRLKQVNFTTEVFPTRNIVLSRKPHRVIETLEELRAERVGTVKGSSMEEAVRAAGVPSSNVVDTIPSGQMPSALRDGRATAIVLGVENAILDQRKDPELQFGMFLGPPRSLAYAVRKEDKELLQALNEYIENLRRTATWSRLVVKYFGEAGLEILKTARQQSGTTGGL